MTSANTILYNIYNKQGEPVGSHSQNIMCKICNDVLEKFIPAKDFEIESYGYDEDEEMWKGDRVNLADWLEKNKAQITFKIFKAGDIINLNKKRGSAKIVNVQKGTWCPAYLVKMGDNEVTINQNEIIP